jgi:hypothetical protein
MKKLFLLMLASAALNGSAWAGVEDAVPSCYGDKLGVASVAPDTELFVLIDQTTVFDATLQQQLADNLRPFMAAGHAYSVLTFSAFSQGRYAQVLSAGTIEPPIPVKARDDISKPVLAKFDACAKRQPLIAMQAIGSALREAFREANSGLAKSDVLASLKSISARVKKSPAKHKLILLASDMLENSSVTSFYGPKGESVRHIDPAKEIKAAVDNDLIGDFGGARIYVIGTGLLADESKSAGKYRDPKTMRALTTFWTSYFQKSNATVMEIGQPALLNKVAASR